MPTDSRQPGPKLTIEVSASRPFRGIDRRRLAAQTRQIAGLLGLRSGEVSIHLADDGEMGRLHEQHKGLAGPTDVLTFHFSEATGERGQLEVEIVVGAEVAQREAGRRGREAGVEALLYIVHGLLHCLGYDDHDPAQARKMHLREDELLTAIGLGAVFHDRA